MPVTGFGGLFFRSDDPKGVLLWYKTHLGIGVDGPVWQQAVGPSVLAAFPKSSDYFPTEKQWMLNLRVSDIDALLADLAAAGIAIIRKPEWDASGFGRFARIHDPEGNPIELWEPPAD